MTNSSNNLNQGSADDVVKSNVKKVRVLNLPKDKPDPDFIKCSMCDIVIKFKKNMLRHLSLVHGVHGDKEVVNDSSSYECCENSFSSQYHLDRHTKSKNCSKNLIFECRKCLCKFVTQEKLSIHTTKNCSKKYMCTLCFKFFKSKREFEVHMSSHSQLIRES